METPKHRGKGVLAKVAIFFAVILLLSLGLCGLSLGNSPFGGGSDLTAVISLIGMVVSGIALIVVGAIAIVNAFINSGKKKQ